ncbi:MAG: hypothetical protein QOH74_1108 [Gaiellales bacterium]|jgi:hypothetical protein|nr:hypothetical protein [Gaiellales bacterium]
MNNDTTMTRLRNANPVRTSHVADTDALFESITATPADARLAARPSARRPRRRRAVTVAVVVGLTALLVTAVAAAYDQFSSAPIVEPKVTKQEYEQATHQLTLPPGLTWPDFNMPPNTVTSQGGGGSEAVNVSQHAWECYWVDAIHSGNTAGQARSHTELQAILDNNVFEAPQGASESWAPQPTPKVPYAVYAPDGGLKWVQEMYDMAAAGQPQRLIQSCAANG